jgi:RNA polymerase sigma factor (sigma-70 family)
MSARRDLSGDRTLPYDRRGGSRDPIEGLGATGMSMGMFDADDDRSLMAAVVDGDERALRLLFGRHAPWLGARLRHRCGDDEVIADVLADTFVAVWRGAGGFRGEGDVAAWLWGIAARRLVSRLRGRPLPEPWTEQALDAVAEPLASAEDQVLLGVEHGDLGRALSTLSPELLAVVQATILDGLSTREAARLLGIPQGTLKGRLRKAKVELRDALVADRGAEGRLV